MNNILPSEFEDILSSILNDQVFDKVRVNHISDSSNDQISNKDVNQMFSKMLSGDTSTFNAEAPSFVPKIYPIIPSYLITPDNVKDAEHKLSILPFEAYRKGILTGIYMFRLRVIVSMKKANNKVLFKDYSDKLISTLISVLKSLYFEYNKLSEPYGEKANVIKIGLLEVCLHLYNLTNFLCLSSIIIPTDLILHLLWKILKTESIAHRLHIELVDSICQFYKTSIFKGETNDYIDRILLSFIQYIIYSSSTVDYLNYIDEKSGALLLPMPREIYDTSKKSTFGQGDIVDILLSKILSGNCSLSKELIKTETKVNDQMIASFRKLVVNSSIDTNKLLIILSLTSLCFSKDRIFILNKVLYPIVFDLLDSLETHNDNHRLLETNNGLRMSVFIIYLLRHDIHLDLIDKNIIDCFKSKDVSDDIILTDRLHDDSPVSRLIGLFCHYATRESDKNDMINVENIDNRDNTQSNDTLCSNDLKGESLNRNEEFKLLLPIIQGFHNEINDEINELYIQFNMDDFFEKFNADANIVSTSQSTCLTLAKYFLNYGYTVVIPDKKKLEISDIQSVQRETKHSDEKKTIKKPQNVSHSKPTNRRRLTPRRQKTSDYYDSDYEVNNQSENLSDKNHSVKKELEVVAQYDPKPRKLDNGYRKWNYYYDDDSSWYDNQDYYRNRESRRRDVTRRKPG